MRYTKTKNFEHQGRECVKVGTVELYADELREHVNAGKFWILTRECAYIIAGESCERGTFLYKKVPTRTRTNTLPHRFFVLTWDGVKNYVADGWKAWRVRFDDQDKAVEEEYNMRENTMVNTCIEGSTVWMEPGEANDNIIREWFSDAELEPMEPEVTARMFHPVYTA